MDPSLLNRDAAVAVAVWAAVALVRWILKGNGRRGSQRRALCFSYVFPPKVSQHDHPGLFFDKETGYLCLRSEDACKKIWSKATGRNPDVGLGDLFQRWMGCCLGVLATDDGRWTELKRVFLPLFLAKDVQELVHDLISDWQATLEKLYETGEPISIETIVGNLPLWFLLRLIFGKSFTEEHREEFESLRVDAEILMFNVFQNSCAKHKFYRYLPTELNNTHRRFNTNWKSILRSGSEDKRAREEGLLGELEGRFKEAMAKPKHKSTPLKWTHFRHTLLEIVFANQDVTNPAMSWLLVAYSLHPNAVHSTTEVVDFIDKVGRIKPVLPRSMPRITTEDLSFDEITDIKAGTYVVIDFDGFLYGEGESSTSPIQFGFGGRRCPGQSLAKNQLLGPVLLQLSRTWQLHVSPETTQPPSLLEVPSDPNQPFFSSPDPSLRVWLISRTFPKHCQYQGNESAQSLAKTEPAFMAVSINKRSPFLDPERGEDNVASVVRHLRDRSIINGNKYSTAIYLCDAVASLNFQAFEKHPEERANEEATRLGNLFEEKFNRHIQALGANERVRVYRYCDDRNHGWINDDFLRLLKDHKVLDERVEAVAQKFLQHRGQRKLSSSVRRLVLCKEYVFREIPPFLTGIFIDGIHYKLLYYGGNHAHMKTFMTDHDSLHKLIHDMRNDEQFRDITEQIVQRSKAKSLSVPGFVSIEF